MSDEKQTDDLELARLVEGAGLCAAGEEERLERWGEAFARWLEERRARGSAQGERRGRNTWKEFIGFTQALPWQVTTEMVAGYVEWLGEQGRQAGTIGWRLRSISKFYEFTQEFFQREGTEAEEGEGFNPAAAASRPKVRAYEKANILSPAEERALLKTIRSDPSPTGKRDYAFFLTLLRSGCRPGDLLRLKWGELEEEGGRWQMRFTSRGKTRRVWLPREALRAIREGLAACGRLEGIGAEEHVFAPSRQPLVREARDRREDWAGERPLSSAQARRLLKLYAGWAGLKQEEITFHTLRHTAAMRMQEAGWSAEEIRTRQGRQKNKNTGVCLRRLSAKPRARLRAGQRLRWERGKAPPRGPVRAEVQHGLYAKTLPELEDLEAQGVRLRGIERELERCQIVAERAGELLKQSKERGERRRLINVVCRVNYRLVRLLRLRGELRRLREEMGMMNGEMGEE